MNGMRVSGAVVWALGLCLGASAQEPAMSHLSALGEALQGAGAWQAAYTQEYVAAGMSAGEIVCGSVTVAWPDRAIFRSGEPLRQIMALDGRKVRLIDMEVPSCDEHMLDDEEWARVPLAAVLDPGGAVERFSVLDLGGEGFALEPRQTGGVARVEVKLGTRSLPDEVVVIDPQGAVNRLQFSGWTATEPPSDDGWLPEPPAGVECVSDS